MKLKILLPAEVFLVEDVSKVVAEADNGFFCLLPHHVDFTASLVPGVFAYQTGEGEHYLAIVVGTLVKMGADFLVWLRNVALSD
jgi:F-type H+-transporting ATPase subunit epsilon